MLVWFLSSKQSENTKRGEVIQLRYSEMILRSEGIEASSTYTIDSVTNVTNVGTILVKQTIWKYTLEKIHILIWFWLARVLKPAPSTQCSLLIAYKCNQCGHDLSQASTLRKHMKIHSGEKSYHSNISRWFCLASVLKQAPPTQRSLLISWTHIGSASCPGHTIYSPIIEKWLGSYA